MISCRCLAATALALLCGCEIEQVERMVDDARVKARVGVMANTEIGWMSTAAKLKAALRFYRASGVDAVVITGDVTKDGYRNQFEVLEQVWKDVFQGQSTRLILADGKYEIGGFEFAVASNRPSAKSDVLTFYGGRKLALTDELCLYPRDSRMICAGSMRGVDVPDWCEDKQLKSRAATAAQGLLVSAYSGKTVVRRLDFSQREPEDVADPWELDAEGVAEDPPAVPEFWEDTRVQVLIGYRGAEAVYTVKWPSALKRFTGARARWYELEVAYAGAPTRPFKRVIVISGNFFLSETRDAVGVTYVLPASSLPESGAEQPKIVFSVTPVGYSGKRGKTRSSDPVPLYSAGKI